jgi:hypothetical protein
LHYRGRWSNCNLKRSSHLPDDINSSRATRGHDDSGFDFRTTHVTDDSGFNLRAPCGSDDSSRRLLSGTYLTSGSPTGASRVADRRGFRLSRGSYAPDAFPRACQLPTTQALCRRHSLPFRSQFRPPSSILIEGWLWRKRMPLSFPMTLGTWLRASAKPMLSLASESSSTSSRPMGHSRGTRLDGFFVGSRNI